MVAKKIGKNVPIVLPAQQLIKLREKVYFSPVSYHLNYYIYLFPVSYLFSVIMSYELFISLITIHNAGVMSDKKP